MSVRCHTFGSCFTYSWLCSVVCVYLYSAGKSVGLNTWSRGRFIINWAVQYHKIQRGFSRRSACPCNSHRNLFKCAITKLISRDLTRQSWHIHSVLLCPLGVKFEPNGIQTTLYVIAFSLKSQASWYNQTRLPAKSCSALRNLCHWGSFFFSSLLWKITVAVRMGIDNVSFVQALLLILPIDLSLCRFPHWLLCIFCVYAYNGLQCQRHKFYCESLNTEHDREVVCSCSAPPAEDAVCLLLTHISDTGYVGDKKFEREMCYNKHHPDMIASFLIFHSKR